MQIDIAPIFAKTVNPPDFFPIIANKFKKRTLWKTINSNCPKTRNAN